MFSIKSKEAWNGKQAIEVLQNKSIVIKHKKDLDRLIEKAAEAKIVLLGEATHGTHEFYTWRSYISQQLIREKGFDL